MSYKNIEYTKLDLGDEHDNKYANNDGENELYNRSEESNDEESSKAGFLSFKYYQNLFDIDTNDVLKRLLFSFIPNPKAPSFLQSKIASKPDMYGPFWICTTLILTITVSGNIANYLQYQGLGHFWRYDFQKLSLAAFCIYMYWWLVPSIVWAVFKSYKIQTHGSLFLELLTLFGYSMTIYIPISILWVIQISWIQWSLVLVALVLSGGVLMLSLIRKFNEADLPAKLPLLLVVALMHSAMAIGFMLYFFYVPSVDYPKASTKHSKLESNLTFTKL